MIHHDHLKILEKYTRIDILKQRAVNIEAISHELKEHGNNWYTLYCTTSVVIQASEVIGTSTVERVKEGHAPLQVTLPCSLAEVTALGITDSLTLEKDEEIAPALLMDLEPGPRFGRQASSLTDKSEMDISTRNTGTEDQDKGTDI